MMILLLGSASDALLFLQCIGLQALTGFPRDLCYPLCQVLLLKLLTSIFCLSFLLHLNS
jgi:hypothetical protein